MTSIEQLTKQHLLHLRSEENFTNNFLENATTHSNISIEFAIECLEEFKNDYLNTEETCLSLLEDKINGLKQKIQ